MKPLSDLEMERAAFHEAGHAVVSVYLAVPFEYVEIARDGSGGVFLPKERDISSSELKTLARNQIIVAYAGAAAQGLFYPNQPERELRQCSEDDRQKIGNIAADFPDVQTGEEARAKAKAIVEECRVEIAKTAEMLLKKGRLSFKDVEDIYTDYRA